MTGRVVEVVIGDDDPTKRYVLDTSVLIAGVRSLRGELAISAVSVAELHFGVLKAPTEATRAERLRLLTDVERRFDALPVDDAVAASYGAVAAAVVRAGRQPRARSMDLLIAATAHAHRAALYTYNVDDFRGLEGLVQVLGVRRDHPGKPGQEDR
jgi:toxin FitB